MRVLGLVDDRYRYLGRPRGVGAHKGRHLILLGQTPKDLDILARSKPSAGLALIGGFWEVEQSRAWVVEEPYDVASEDIGWLLDFAKPPGTIKGMVPNGGSDRQKSG